MLESSFGMIVFSMYFLHVCFYEMRQHEIPIIHDNVTLNLSNFLPLTWKVFPSANLQKGLNISFLVPT